MKLFLILFLLPTMVFAGPKEDILIFANEIKTIADTSTQSSRESFNNPLSIDKKPDFNLLAIEKFAVLALNYSAIKRFIKLTPRHRKKTWHIYGVRSSENIQLKLAFRF